MRANLLRADTTCALLQGGLMNKDLRFGIDSIEGRSNLSLTTARLIGAALHTI